MAAETLLDRATRWTCPNNLSIITEYEKNAVKRLVAFGEEVEQSIQSELARLQVERDALAVKVKKLEAVALSVVDAHVENHGDMDGMPGKPHAIPLAECRDLRCRKVAALDAVEKPK